MFYVGSGPDGVTVNAGYRAEDVNSWSYLALRNAGYASSIDWDVRHLSVSRAGFSGVSFCTGDRSGVWFEGTAHLAAALELRNGPGDASRARAYLRDLGHAQTSGPNTNELRHPRLGHLASIRSSPPLVAEKDLGSCAGCWSGVWSA